MGASFSADSTLASCRQLVTAGDDERAPQAQADPSAPQRLSLALRRKLGRGAMYNLKVLVRGDMSTGKSSLVRRLQGLPFQADLPPTREITTGHIDWSAPDCEDTVKVEVWDVCDTAVSEQSKRRSVVTGTPRGLALEHGQGALDADNIDVFRGAHAVVYVFDPRKRWTLEYVQRQLHAVPPRLPVLILTGFADLLAESEAAEVADVVPHEEVQRLAEAEAARRGSPVLSARVSSRAVIFRRPGGGRAGCLRPTYSLVCVRACTRWTYGHQSKVKATRGPVLPWRLVEAPPKEASGRFQCL